MNLYLTLAALVPAVLLFVRIYRLDRVEKEPRPLLARLILLGVLSALPAAAIELGAAYLLPQMLARGSAAYLLIENFLVVALAEEGCKLAAVRVAAWEHPAFDYRFDAIVYCVSAALGFAALENVFYVLQSDLRTAISRALLSVPGHFFFAVSMGVFLSRAKQAERGGQPARMRDMAAMSLLVPVVLHGIWDLCLAVGGMAVWAFYAYVLVFFIAAEYCLRQAARTDGKL